MGLIPGLAHGLRIWCWGSCGVGHNCVWDSVLGLGTSICHLKRTSVWPFKKKKKKIEEESISNVLSIDLIRRLPG